MNDHLTPVEYAVENYMKQWRRISEEAKTAERTNRPLLARMLRFRAAMLDSAIEAEIVNRVKR